MLSAMKKIGLILFITLFLTSFSFAATQKEAYKNDYLYSEEYFDYLIECASYEHQEKMELEKEKNKEKEKEKKLADEEFSEITPAPSEVENYIAEDFEPFKLRIETDSHISPYTQTFVKENSKTLIPVGDKFSFIQNTTKTRNKYNSNDYKVLAGAEFTPFRFLTIASGLETNYRGIDQNPTSRKLYIIPQLYLTDKLSLSFYNKINISSKSTDHDIGLTFSPFKSKFMDFGVYAGITRKQAGAHSESINFSTNIYFF